MFFWNFFCTKSFLRKKPLNFSRTFCPVSDVMNIFFDEEIPLKFIKDNEIFTYHLCKWINETFTSGSFPNSKKTCYHITPTISILPLLSKVFEKKKFNQITKYIEKYL